MLNEGGARVAQDVWLQTFFTEDVSILMKCWIISEVQDDVIVSCLNWGDDGSYGNYGWNFTMLVLDLTYGLKPQEYTIEGDHLTGTIL
jgi:hypothetical protein